MGFQGSRRKPRDAWTDVTRVGRDGVLRVEAASKTSNGGDKRRKPLFGKERSDDWSLDQHLCVKDDAYWSPLG